MIDQNEHLFQALVRIQASWRLGNAEMAALCHVEESAYLGWLARASTPPPESIPSGTQCASALVSIARRLAEKFSSVEAQVEWLTTPHTHFDQNKPLDVALSSPENLQWLAYYLESVGRFEGATP